MGDASPSRQAVIENAKQHLRDQGWAVIPDILSRDESDNVLARLWKAKETGEQRGDPSYLPSLDPNQANVRIFYLLELDEIFRDLIAHPVAIEMVKSVLGEDFLISNFTANIARPGSESMGLHSDQSIVISEPWPEVWALNVIWCFTDVYKENGATLYIPGSNKYQYRKDIPENANQLLQPFEAKAGSIILMDGRVWHTSGANVTKDQDRALCFGYYTKPFIRQQVNWTAKLPRELQDSLSENMKEWLGLHPTGNIGRAGAIHYNYLSKQYAKTDTAVPAAHDSNHIQ
jgi:fumagillin biosynthesis dioxygenase